MLTCFYEASTVLQVLLSILSQLTVIVLLSSVLLFQRRYGTPTRSGMGAVLLLLLLLNAALCIVMQLDSRLTGTEQAPHLHLPYVVLFAVTVFSLVYSLWSLLRSSKKTAVINNTSVKESFDNLPTGVCFFNESGLPVLCNLAMHRFSFAVSGKDVQFITDLEECLAEDFAPLKGVTKDGKAFVLTDGRVLQLERNIVTYEDGSRYVQFIAPDVTDLYKTHSELAEENAQLRKVQTDLQRLSANVVTVTREEEILNTKMRVHDEMGRCLVAAQKYLREGGGNGVTDQVVSSWQRAVSMLRYNNEPADEDMLSQIRKTCDSIKLKLIQTGSLPKEEDAAYILACAVRECVTNAVRYAGATELYADFTETDTIATVIIANDGKAPDNEIIEGGGLSTLRRRVERAGGVMMMQSRPQFKLTVTVPKGKEGVL